jgi:ribose transport system ATP-binding protein
MGEAFLEVSHAVKTYPGVRALDDVSITFNRGEVHALVGENGAGKSTLIKAISGYEKLDSGEIIVAGESHPALSIQQAIELGIGTVYQDLLLATHLSVAENVFMGQLPLRHGLIDRKRLFEDTRSILDELGVDIDVAAPVESLPVSKRQFVSIARALARQATMLIMDEPTATLTEADAEVLFGLVDTLKRRGVSIVYITHRLDEVFRVADRITAMRDGRIVASLTPADITQNELVSIIAGRDISSEFPERTSEPGKTALSISHLSGTGVHDVSIEVREGEVLGIYGLMGSGTEEFGRLLFGATKATAGSVTFKNRPLANKNPNSSVASGVGYIPSDRKNDALLGSRAVGENLTIAALNRFLRHQVIDGARESSEQDALIRRLGIRTPSRDMLVSNLSGGNQQKVVLGRWLANDSQLLILDEPTQGVDVGARYEIYEAIRELAEKNICIVIISSDLQELMGMCDRIVVMHDGACIRSFNAADGYEQREIIAAASGIKQ